MVYQSGWMDDQPGSAAIWWSSSVADKKQAWGQILSVFDNELKSQTFSRGDFLNVRCLKN